MHILLFLKGRDPSRNIIVRFENLTVVFKNTANMTTARCRRFVGASVTLYQTDINMISENVFGRNRGEQRDDDDNDTHNIKRSKHSKLFRTYPSVFCVIPASREICDMD